VNCAGVEVGCLGCSPASTWSSYGLLQCACVGSRTSLWPI